MSKDEDTELKSDEIYCSNSAWHIVAIVDGMCGIDVT
jgi:hypothetical protein